MDISTILLLFAGEVAANSCAPYACIGPNSEASANEVKPPYNNECVDYTYYKGIKMGCEEKRAAMRQDRLEREAKEAAKAAAEEVNK